MRLLDTPGSLEWTIEQTSALAGKRGGQRGRREIALAPNPGASLPPGAGPVGDLPKFQRTQSSVIRPPEIESPSRILLWRGRHAIKRHPDTLGGEYLKRIESSKYSL